jgi:hypothetical protein
MGQLEGEGVMDLTEAQVDEAIEVAYQLVREREMQEDAVRGLELAARCPPNMRMVLRMVVELVRELGGEQR